MAFRLFQNSPVQFNNDGTVCAGGEVRIYENNSTTPTNAGDGPDLSPSLGATLTLDASGRLEDDAWLADGSYRVRLYTGAAPDGVLVWSLDDVQDGSTGGVTVPDPSTGDEDDVLSTDGVDFVFRAIREVPDPTGHSGKVLKNDGVIASWQAEQTIPEYDADNLPGGITATATRLVVGDVAFVWGNDSAPSSGTLKTTKAITFATAFSGTPYHVGVSPTSNSSTGESGACSSQTLSAGASGFTAAFFAGAEDNGGVAEINTTVPFTYFAVGPA